MGAKRASGTSDNDSQRTLTFDEGLLLHQSIFVMMMTAPYPAAAIFRKWHFPPGGHSISWFLVILIGFGAGGLMLIAPSIFLRRAAARMRMGRWERSWLKVTTTPFILGLPMLVRASSPYWDVYWRARGIVYVAFCIPVIFVFSCDMSILQLIVQWAICFATSMTWFPTQTSWKAFCNSR